jgi:ABC-type antimicrobial peptide transport system permease subunit
VRTGRPANELIPVLRAKLKELDPTIFVYDADSLEKVVGSSFDNRRAVMLLLAAFAGLALFLSSLGIYGVLAYDVSQRTREIGVRGAIGASHGQIVGLILGQGLWKAGIGIVIGLTGAYFLSHYMTTLLYGVKPTEPSVYVAVSLVLIVVAALASYLPARRAAKIDPLTALRDE